MSSGTTTGATGWAIRTADMMSVVDFAVLSHRLQSYRPLSVLSFRIDHMLFGLDPFYFHLTSVLMVMDSIILVVIAVVGA